MSGANKGTTGGAIAALRFHGFQREADAVARQQSALEAIVEAGRMSVDGRSRYCAEIARLALEATR